ncbi:MULTISPECIES: hypothetical protein [Burkholderiaceae]|uniref:Uncharacterized protein n=1 Tax=Caballeronia sordidicola TaxID=196367 RepID=A0A242MGH4_CABSO|nr:MULTISPECIES: hypothetical protein [Burkholderiaceae]OTP69099.1 hypothetical protein PAMC26577_31615 [Caballeronia sordidicola]OTP70402.1 hypothetical protein PAMC26510_25575 [Caballeronia sordidicola]
MSPIASAQASTSALGRASDRTFSPMVASFVMITFAPNTRCLDVTLGNVYS